MGGFVLRAHDDPHSQTSANSKAAMTYENRLDAVLLVDKASQAFSKVGKVNELIEQNSPEGARNDRNQASSPEKLRVTPNSFHLNAQQVIKLRRSGNLNKLTFVTDVEINDKEQK